MTETTSLRRATGGGPAAWYLTQEYWNELSPWFAKNDHRAARRHRCDHNDTRIQSEGPSSGECQILDLSQTGARLAVMNAESFPDTFVLILSKNRTGRPARVIWRRGSEIGAEFFIADSAVASGLTHIRAHLPLESTIR